MIQSAVFDDGNLQSLCVCVGGGPLNVPKLISNIKPGLKKSAAEPLIQPNDQFKRATSQIEP